MSNLSQIVAYRRSQGGSVAGSLAGGIKERLKEKFDPRQLINQKGLIASLFPGLKPFKAKTSGASRTSGKSIEQSSVDISEVKPLFEQIQYNTTLTTKNLTVLPSIHRDFNVIRQNIVKLLKLEKIDARTKADMYFKAAAKREEMYESQLEKLRQSSKSPSKVDNSKSEGSFKNILMTIGAVALIGLAFKGVSDAIDKLKDVDLKKSLFDFSDNLTNSINGLIDSLMLKLKTLNLDDLKPNLNIIPEAKAGEITDRTYEFPSDVPAGQINLKDVFDKILQSEALSDYNLAFGDRFNKKTQKYENVLDKSKYFNIEGKPQPKQLTPEEYAEQNLGGRKKLTEFTMAEVLKFQQSREKVRPGQTAIGGFQFMGSTLFGLEPFGYKGKEQGIFKESGLSWTSKFDENNQRVLASILMKRNEASLEYLKIPVTPANLAMSWGIGTGGVAAVHKALAQGRGNETLYEVMKKAGLPHNIGSNPWMNKPISEYVQKKIERYGNTPGKVIIQKPSDKISLLLNDIMTGNMIENGSFDVSIQDKEQSIPVVVISNNTFQENIIISENQNVEKDYLPFLFRNFIS